MRNSAKKITSVIYKLPNRHSFINHNLEKIDYLYTPLFLQHTDTCSSLFDTTFYKNQNQRIFIYRLIFFQFICFLKSFFIYKYIQAASPLTSRSFASKCNKKQFFLRVWGWPTFQENSLKPQQDQLIYYLKRNPISSMVPEILSFRWTVGQTAIILLCIIDI